MLLTSTVSRRLAHTNVFYETTESPESIRATEQHIASGADLDIRHPLLGNDVSTPLMRAAKQGRASSMELLMRAGASTTMRDGSGCLPLTCAAFGTMAHYIGAEGHPHTRCVDILMEQASDAHVTEALNAACSAMNPLALLSLLRSTRPGSVYLDARAEDGNTPLTTVCGRMGSGDGVRCARILLHRGANVNATRADGWTPLAIATMAGRESLVELLLTHHDIVVNPVVDVNWEEVEQLWATWGALHPEGIDTTMTPLLIAASMRNTRIVAALLRHDDIDTLATTGGTRAEQIARGDIAAMIIEARRTQAYRSRRGKMAAFRIQRFLRDTTCNPVYAAARRSLERLCLA